MNAAPKTSSRMHFTEAHSIASSQERLSAVAQNFKTAPETRLTGKNKLPSLVNATSSPAAQQVGERRYEMIPLAMIRANRFAPRKVYTDAMLKARAESIVEYGQHDPIHVIPDPDFPGGYVIGDGWTRVTGCLKFSEITELLAEIHTDKNEREISFLGYIQNESREGHSAVDRAFYFNSLVESGLLATDVALELCVSDAVISRHLALFKLPPDLIDFINKYPERFPYQTFAKVNQLLQKTDIDTALSLMGKLAHDPDMSIRAWEQLVRKEISATEKDSKNSSTLANKKTFNNGFYSAANGSFKLSLKLKGEMASAFEQEIQLLIDKYAEAMPDSTNDSSDVSSDLNKSKDDAE